jgi:hypothetical protein
MMSKVRAGGSAQGSTHLVTPRRASGARAVQVAVIYLSAAWVALQIATAIELMQRAWLPLGDPRRCSRPESRSNSFVVVPGQLGRARVETFGCWPPKSHSSTASGLIGCRARPREVDSPMRSPALMLVACAVCRRLHEPNDRDLIHPVCDTCRKASGATGQRRSPGERPTAFRPPLWGWPWGGRKKPR